MAKEKYEMKDNSGSLFHETKVTVPRKGKFKINGIERYGAILKYEDRDGKEKYELVQSLGLLHYNPPEEKKNPLTPDIGGKITLVDSSDPNNKVFKCGGYANTTQSGVDYTGLKFTPYDSEGNLVIPDKKETKDPAF
jgi:hypothetical protein|tara:strand:+ start:4780 stop:5190 length:411 start_codon:yes stop_codon:yes gene_type:complete